MKISEIIESVENFYDVRSDGLSGELKNTIDNLSKSETYSNQASKNLIRHRRKIRQELSREDALSEIEYFENMGLRCRLVHSGPMLLSKYPETEIRDLIVGLA